MKVGILIHCLEQGGAQSMVLRLLDSFDAAGIETYLVTIDRNWQIRLSSDKDRDVYLSRRIIQLSNSDVRWSTFRKTLMTPWQWIRLHRTVTKLHLDIVLSFMERANILNLLNPLPQTKIISIRKHVSMALSAKDPLKRDLIIHLYPYLLWRAKKVNFNSWEAAGDFTRRFPLREDQISVIYNYCDACRLLVLSRETMRYEYRSFFENPVVITAGRLIHAKGHVHLLRAFRHVSAGDPHARLVILGSGPLKNRLHVLARSLHIENRILMPGFQTNPFSWIGRAKLFILPSLAEGFPNSLLEAMALGLPVISTDCPSGPREMLSPGTDPTNKTRTLDRAPYGILTPPLDGKVYDAQAPLSREEQVLADAMKLLLKDEKLRIHYARAALQRVRDFSPERIIPAWLDLIRV